MGVQLWTCGSDRVSATPQMWQHYDQASSAQLAVSGIAAQATEVRQIKWMQDPSYCLSADGNTVGNGVKLQLWNCDESWGSSGQIFDVSVPGQIKVHADPKYCVVVDGD